MTGVDHFSFSKQRIEALTDGVCAVALTLLVLDLKLPEREAIHSNAQFEQALGNLLPVAVSWLISFFFLAVYWLRHQQLFHYLQRVDGRLSAIALLHLLLVSLLPFSSSILGRFGSTFAGALVYSLNLALMAVVLTLLARYIRKHPELCETPLPAPIMAGVAMRSAAIVVCCLLAGALALWDARFSGLVFLVLVPLIRWSRRTERRALLAEGGASASN